MKRILWFVCFSLLIYPVKAQSVHEMRLITANEVEEGDGAVVHRLIPQKRLKHYDPYVLLDDFTITPPSGFPDHFHSGFEVITYLRAGKLQHKDSRGNQVVLEAGDIQCFTTGSGVVHSEMPQGAEKVKGFQIWINLPKVDKQISPNHEVIKASAVPWVKINDQVSVKTIAGQGATVHTRAELLIKEYDLKAGAAYNIVLPQGFQGLLYVIAGGVHISSTWCNPGQAVLFSTENLVVNTFQDAVVLLVSGLPLGEPIHRKGSIVK